MLGFWPIDSPKSMNLPFVGPSYTLATRQASAQRAVNLYLQAMETPSKAGVIMRAVPGFELFAALGATIRGGIEASGRAFFVAGGTLYELTAAGGIVTRGALLTTTGSVGMAWGVTQLVIVDGVYGYVMRLATNVFERITDVDWPGSDLVAYLGGFFIIKPPNTQQFYVTAIDDATSVDALEFASAESAPDRLIAHIVVNERLFLLGETTTENWYLSGAADFPLSKAGGETIDVGCIAKWSVCKADAGMLWVGRDLNGAGIVYRTNGGPPQRVSNVAIEEMLQSSSNLAAATAYVYQDHGQTFYAIRAPGVASTIVYEISTNAWHEQCELDEFGQFKETRATHRVFAMGLQLIGDVDGNVYRVDRALNTFAGDPRVCERTSPNDVTPLRDLKTHSAFVMDCQTGAAPTGTPMVELSWSNDGGQSFGNPVERSAGSLGNRYPRLVWRKLGRARDRVWKVRFSADAPFAIINADTQ